MKLTILLAALSLTAQVAPPSATFEVASIKPSGDCGPGRAGISFPPGRIDVVCAPLRGLVRLAYAEQSDIASLPALLEVLGGPAWLDNERYDVSARADSAAPRAIVNGPMLRALLAERLKLKTHIEERDAPAFELSVLKSGAKLTPSREGSCVRIANIFEAAPLKAGERACGPGRLTSTADRQIKIDWYGESLSGFVQGMLPTQVGGPVIDKTGLTGAYDIHLEYTFDPSLIAGGVILNGVAQAPAPPAETAGPSIFTAIQEQLGLRLMPVNGTKKVLVIDSAERPSAN